MTGKQWLSFIALTIIWGASFLWIKIAVRETHPFVIVALRLVLAVVALIPFLFATKARLPRGRIWIAISVQGLISAALPWILITWAEVHVDSALAGVLNASVPMFTIILAHLFLSDDRITGARVLGLLVGFGGVLLLILARSDGIDIGSNGSSKVLLAQLAILGASFLYAASNIYARKNLKGLPPVIQAFTTLLVADAFLWLVTPAVTPIVLPELPITWVAITWLGVLGAGISYVIYYRLLHEIGPTRVAMVTYTIPIVSLILGVTLLHERFDWPLVVGAGGIVSGVWIVNRK